MGHGHSAPELPEIKDEAGDSPRWLPLLGVGIFAVFLIWVILLHQPSASLSSGDESGEAQP